MDIPARIDGAYNPEYHRAYRKKHGIKRQAHAATRYQKLRANGLCGRCAVPSGEKSLCRPCNEEHTWITRRSKARVTKEQFITTWNLQNGCCAICDKDLKEYKYGQADHNHKINKFRGILCMHCNHALGNLLDNPVTAERAAAYLRKMQ